MIGELPTSLEVCGKEYTIRSDYRDVLNIAIALGDPDLQENEKIYLCLYILYEDFELLQEDEYQEAYKKAVEFIDMGQKERNRGKKTMDWEQDEQLLFPAINSVAGFEIRSKDYIHWWTFMGYFMEIRKGVFSQILTLRQKRNNGKKLEKEEQEFWNKNIDICVLKTKLSEEEKAEKEKLEALLNY